MPEPTKPSGKSRVSATTLGVVCGLLVLLFLAVAFVYPVVREVQFIERMEANGFSIATVPRTIKEWGPLNRWNLESRQLFDPGRSNTLGSLRPLRNNSKLETIHLKNTPMTKDHLSELGTLKNLKVFLLAAPVDPDFATRLPHHFPNIIYLSLAFNSENIEAWWKPFPG